MKYVIVIGDGMADWNIESLGNRTPLEAADKPNSDYMAQNGMCGLVQIVPQTMYPGSDVSNLSILGYDPQQYYTGRSPLEAASIGIDLSDSDVAVRCNIVTLDGTIPEGKMIDYSAGHISTEESRILLQDLSRETRGMGVDFYPGVSYRNLMVWKGGTEDVSTVPPHDIMGKGVGEFLPAGNGAGLLGEIMRTSQRVFNDHPLNRKRAEEGKNLASSVWLWGQGKAPQMPSFKETYGKEGSIIAAVDLIKGIGIYLGLSIIDVPGATGYLDTNYDGKGKYCCQEIETRDFVLVHVEAPDEAGHNGDAAEKVKAIEKIDRYILGPVIEKVRSYKGGRVLFLPDHPTPVQIRTHSNEPVPFVIYPAGNSGSRYSASRYTEAEARKTGLVVERGWDLVSLLMGE